MTATIQPGTVTHRRQRTLAASVAAGVALLSGCGSDGVPARDDRPAALRPTTVAEAPAPGAARLAITCPLQDGSGTLPASTRRGLIQHLLQYPALQLATRIEHAAAVRLLAEIERAAETGHWYDASVAASKGFVRRTVRRKPGDRSVHYLHAELLSQRRGGPLFDPRRPKALIYANSPGRPLVLVGAMYSMKRGEQGPSPGGPITRWHSHLVCAVGEQRGTKPPDSGSCPPGARLRQGSEMLHVWFTGDLRSAFAIRAPEPELCASGLLPAGYCRTLDGRPRGM